MSIDFFDPIVIRSSLSIIFIYIVYVVLMALLFMKYIGEFWVHTRWKLLAFFVMITLSLQTLIIEQSVSSLNPFSIFAFIIIGAIVMANLVFFDHVMNTILFIFLTLFRLMLLLKFPFGVVLASHIKYIILFLASTYAYYRVYRLRHRYYFIFSIIVFILFVEAPIVYNKEPWLYAHIVIFSIAAFIITHLYVTVIERFKTYYEYAHKDF